MTSEFLPIPTGFAGRTINREGEAGRAWIERLPQIVGRLLQDWQLTVVGAPISGTVGLVWEVHRLVGTTYMLKVGWRDPSSIGEAAALRRWSGEGAVTLIDSRTDVGALLMERLDPRTSLTHVEISRAVDVAAGLLKLLHVPLRSGFPGALDQELDSAPVSDTYRERLRELRPAVERAFADSPSVLLHGDFHYENILRSGSSWKAIDPKPALGPREWDLVPLLRNRFDEFPAGDQLLPSIRDRLDALIARTGANPWRAYLFAHYRALRDADYAHRTNDQGFEDVSNAIAVATRTGHRHDTILS